MRRGAVQIPVKVRMRPYELRTRMYRRVQRMMRVQTTGQGTDDFAAGVATADADSAAASADATSTSSRSAVRRREIRYRGRIWIRLVAVLARHVRERPDSRLRGHSAGGGRRTGGRR